MVRGVLNLIKSTAQGIECFLREAASNLTLPQNIGTPHISIEVEDSEDNEAESESKCREMVAS
jgi:hypothetical protein